eukprot:scaffold309_cov235-Pinguiococcus_pyrenoidosus.AAC.8
MERRSSKTSTPSNHFRRHRRLRVPQNSASCFPLVPGTTASVFAKLWGRKCPEKSGGIATWEPRRLKPV